MSNRLEILKGSLAKKEARFDSIISSHFEDVKSANGQPLNDKPSHRARAVQNKRHPGAL